MNISELQSILGEFFACYGDLEVVIVDADSGLPLAIDKAKIRIEDCGVGICADYDDIIEDGGIDADYEPFFVEAARIIP